MNFPSGIPVQIPGELLFSGKSGVQQVKPPEQPVPLSRMTDAALERLANDMLALLESETRDATDTRLTDYIDLISLQCMQEINRRCF